MVDTWPILPAVPLQPYSNCPVVAGGDDAVLSRDEAGGGDLLPVSGYLGEEYRAALRPGVDLSRHDQSCDLDGTLAEATIHVIAAHSHSAGATLYHVAAPEHL